MPGDNLEKRAKLGKKELILPKEVNPKNTGQVIAFFNQNYKARTPEEKEEIDNLLDEFMANVRDRFGIRRSLFFQDLHYLEKHLRPEEYEIVVIGFLKQEADFGKYLRKISGKRIDKIHRMSYFAYT